MALWYGYSCRTRAGRLLSADETDIDLGIACLSDYEQTNHCPTLVYACRPGWQGLELTASPKVMYQYWHDAWQYPYG
jgi:hypothetical protein